ncbi:hypothetical protein [Bdellovibrio bacteriovorus]
MEISKEQIEAILVLLYKLEEVEACNAMIEIYKKYFVAEEEKPTIH